MNTPNKTLTFSLFDLSELRPRTHTGLSGAETVSSNTSSKTEPESQEAFSLVVFKELEWLGLYVYQEKSRKRAVLKHMNESSVVVGQLWSKDHIKTSVPQTNMSSGSVSAARWGGGDCPRWLTNQRTKPGQTQPSVHSCDHREGTRTQAVCGVHVSSAPSTTPVRWRRSLDSRVTLVNPDL